MRAKEREHAKQKAGHHHEDKVEERVFFPVERIGVRNVSCKSDGGTRVAFGTGGADVLFGKLGVGIGYREDIMVAVAVEAGCHIAGDVRLAQSHRFAVVGIPVMLQAFLVAFAATVVADLLEMRVAGKLDFVGSVAVVANRSAGVAFEQQLAVNALVVFFLDSKVAFPAGGSKVRLVDR